MGNGIEGEEGGREEEGKRGGEGWRERRDLNQTWSPVRRDDGGRRKRGDWDFDHIGSGIYITWGKQDQITRCTQRQGTLRAEHLVPPPTVEK